MLIRLREDAVPKTFTQLFEWIVYLGLTASSIFVLHHIATASRFSDLAARYDARRIWRDDDPPISARIQEMETRLRKDLEVFESVRDGRSWNDQIWQTWRDRGLEEWRNTWRNLNPTYNYTLVLDDAADSLIQETFQGVPDIVDLWTAFPKAVLRADLFRYLITYAFGGMYADVDTSCTNPIDYWMPQELWNDPEIHALIGIEYQDIMGGSGHWWRHLDFVQYVMMTKPLSPIMRETIIMVVTRSHRLVDKYDVPSVKEVDWSFDNVLKTTGPLSFTDGCLKVIQKETGHNEAAISLKTYARMAAHKVGGVVVVPVKDWQAGGRGVPERYFIHHGQGSWM